MEDRGEGNSFNEDTKQDTKFGRVGQGKTGDKEDR